MIIGNYSRLTQNPQRHLFCASYQNEVFFGGASLAMQRSNSALYGSYAAVPRGYYPPYCWVMPRQVRDMASRNLTSVSVSGAGTAALGLGFPATSSITVTPQGVAGLIAGAVASGAIQVDASGDVVATIAARGEGSITVDADAITSAIAWLAAGGSMTVDADLVSYAVGHMSGTTQESGTLTPQAIALAIWTAAAESFSDPSTMGGKVNAAGTAGDPWGSSLDSYEEGTAGYIIEQIRLLTDELHKLRGLDMTTPVTMDGDGVLQTVMTAGDIVVKATPTSVERLQ